MCVRGHVDYLATIVGSILILVRTAQRGLALELSDVPVRELLAEVHTLVEPFAVAGGVSLVVDCEHAPAVVRGERTALLWVLVNLAANAVKFTPSGGRVSLSAVVLSDAVELRVADTGPGIPVSRPDAIVEPVVQAHSTDEGQRRGAGLSIARELTRLMGGELLVRTAVDVGPQVVVRFGDAWRPAQQSARVSTAKAA
jgi:signal transduction histidine kinase